MKRFNLEIRRAEEFPFELYIHMQESDFGVYAFAYEALEENPNYAYSHKHARHMPIDLPQNIS